MERKLAAILCADVFGYSRLTGENEEATLLTLSSHRKIIDSLIAQHHGRFVNSAGDSVLAEFASAVNAVECAVEIQTALKTENADVPVDRRMEFRIGINLGDVVVEGNQIYGDGVNVAARLESLAEAGGIYISASIHEQIGNKLALDYEDLGEQSVKNIAKPVRVFRVLPRGAVSTPRAKPRVARGYWRGGLFSLVGLAIIVGTFVIVQHLSLKAPHTHASIPPQEKPALALPTIPSIAVMPFTNLSDDPKQDYFNDGMTDDLLTDLSRLPSVFVIDRSSAFAYKGKSTKVQEVGRQLGVKYVLEGSAVKDAKQIRINVQLVDATTGDELWAQRYQRPATDIFALQDEITRRIVTTLSLQLSVLEEGKLVRRKTDNLEAYDDELKGMEYQWNSTKAGNEKARQMFEKALDLDQKYADAYVGLGMTYWLDWFYGYSKDLSAPEQAAELAQRAITLDDSNSTSIPSIP